MELEPISREQRTMGGMDFTLLWFGAAISIAEIYVGNIMAPLGWAAGLAAIILGHVIGNLPLALGGNLGVDTGLPTMYVLRPTFGRLGSYLATVLNIVQLVGWTAIMLILSGVAFKTLFTVKAEWPVTVWIVVVGASCTVWAMVGKSTFKWLQRISGFTLGILCLIMTYVLWTKYRATGFAHQPQEALGFGIGLDLAVALPISWLPLVADYSRFARSRGGSFWGTYIGYFVGSCWMFALGLASVLVLDASDPISLMAGLGFAGPALVIVLFSTLTTTFLDIYSTGVSALNLRPATRERWFIVPAGIAGIAAALIIPLADYARYENFLLLVGSFFVPLFGVVLTHWFFMDYRKQQGVRPVEWTAVLAWALGMIVFRYASAHFFLGGSLPSLVASGLIYWLLRKVAGPYPGEIR